MIYTQEQVSVLRYALSELIEQLRSQTSADRAADPAQADRKVAVAEQLLKDLPKREQSLSSAIANLRAVRTYDAVVIDDDRNDGARARAPEGDDYNEILGYTKTALGHLEGATQ